MAFSRLSCLYAVPTSFRSSSVNKGKEMAPGIWAWENSEGLRTSKIGNWPE